MKINQVEVNVSNNNLKPVLNLYRSNAAAKLAFEAACMGLKHGDVYNPRDRVIKTTYEVIHFDSFDKYRKDSLYYTWGEINFFAELPANVKCRYLARIKWVVPTFDLDFMVAQANAGVHRHIHMITVENQTQFRRLNGCRAMAAGLNTLAPGCEY